MIRPAAPEETPALVALAVATGLFRPEDADLLLRQTLDDLHAQRLGDGHFAYVWQDDIGGTPAGWVYFSANPKSNGVWDLWWIGVTPERHGQGIGQELLWFVENSVREAGGRLLLIETSSTPALEKTRRFYRNQGYVECGCIPDFYDDGDGKITFARHVARESSRRAIER